ncbi:MAG: hypothetical protein SF123_19125 [Chloroflexota bacterium]|nr:hypothetical protein [Chloroflexota bacterium]
METIAYGITRKWLFDKQIALYTVDRFGAQPLVDWSSAITDSLKDWPGDRDYIAIHDVSKSGMSLQYLLLTGHHLLAPWLTPSREKAFLEWQNQRPERKVKLAIVTSTQMSGQIMTKRAQLSQSDADWIDSRLFDSLEAAIQWCSASMTKMP